MGKSRLLLALAEPSPVLLVLWPPVRAAAAAAVAGELEGAVDLARDAATAADEADALITLGMIDQYHDPANARALFSAARTQAVGDLTASALRRRQGRQAAGRPGVRRGPASTTAPSWPSGASSAGRILQPRPGHPSTTNTRTRAR